jgi:hypothetical protein
MNYTEACVVKLECDNLIKEYRDIQDRIKENKKLLHELNHTEPKNFKPNVNILSFDVRNTYIKIKLSEYIDYENIYKTELKKLYEKDKELSVKEENLKYILSTKYDYNII